MMRCNVLVVGAGPAGMAAAATAAESGCRVILADDNPAPGGQIWRGYAAKTSSTQPHSAAYLHWTQRLSAAKVQLLEETRVIDSPSEGVLRLEKNTGGMDVAYERLILATGARERFLPFPGWTLPGVMGAGGLQAMAKSGLPVEGKRVVLAGSGPLLLAVAANLTQQGARIAGIFEQAPLARVLRFGAGLLTRPAKLLEGARYRAAAVSAPYRTSSWVTQARGDGRLQSVIVQSGSRRTDEIRCDYLGCGFHLIPNLELPRLLGCAIVDGYVEVDAEMRSSIRTVFCAGELTGIGGLEKALVEGRIAGLAAAGRTAAHLESQRNKALRFARDLDAAFAIRAELRSVPNADTTVCRCEDVRYSALEDLRGERESKLHTRCGMGPCQGRICGPATAFLFGWKSDSTRPPVTPATVATLSCGLEPATKEP